MTNYLGKTQFSNLNTNFYYTSLNEASYDCKDEAFYNAAEEKLKSNSWKENASDKILKALCYVYRKMLIQDYERDICKYLYFWLGNILIDKMKHNHVFQDVIRDLFDILKNHKGKVCAAHTYHIDVENFKNIKLFFDYSKDYDSYENQITYYNPPCNEKYKNYLKSYVDTYKKFQVKCPNGRHSYRYCDIFNEYFADKDPEKLSKWTCNIQPNEPEEEEAWGETEATEEQSSPTHGMEGQNADPRGGFEQGRKQGEEYHSSSDSNVYTMDSQMDSNSLPSDGTPSTIISKSVTGAVSVAGALVPSYLLYNVISIMIKNIMHYFTFHKACTSINKTINYVYNIFFFIH
ncbi:hypothetical protein PVBG_06060 [Plasmodium vivax Brazil I]|uniref:Variable surface protein Vir7-like protein n=1 Tax=Plasmodium vivax (strain Brazil I) TaxID=1033975 RepID=A0A0J9SKW0_PLAV1|nr:hypothetical protein PVBG_06060 [Plasmodium vivax Brazil I]